MTMASLFSIPASHFPILTVFPGAAFFSFVAPISLGTAQSPVQHLISIDMLKYITILL